METKTCTKCGKAKPLDEFYRRRASRDGLTSHCKTCTLRAQRKHYAVNKERIEACSKRWRERNPGWQRSYDLRRSFGITLEDYDEILDVQGGGCAICGMTAEENGRRLAVDHSHKTNEVRGLLCDNCNKALGCLQDNPELCRRAMLYLAGAASITEGHDGSRHNM